MRLTFWQDETAQGALEYALILCLIAIIVIAGLTVFSSGLKESYQNSSAQFPK